MQPLPAEWTDVADLVLQHGALSPQRTLEIIRQVTIALDHAMQRGIVHSQISPENVLVGRDGVVKLAGPGPEDRSRNDNSDASTSRAASSTNRVDYMAPEQADDSQVADVRSEIYSLGCTWYFMLTGQPPFPIGSLTNKLRAHAQTPLPDPRSLNPEVSEAILGVLRKMTQKQPSQRYQTLKELLAGLPASSPVSNAIVREPLEESAPAKVLSEILVLAEDEETRSIEETKKSSRSRKRSRKPRHASADEDVALPRDALSPLRRRNRNQSLESERPKRNNTPLFYVFVGAVIICIAVGVVSLVQDFGTSYGPADGERMGNPFAARDAAAKNTGNRTTNPDGSSNSSIGDSPSSADQASSGTGTASSGAISNSVVNVQIGGHASSPQIEARIKQEREFLPGWATQPRRAGSLVTLTVKPGSSGTRRFPTLHQALEHVPADGALIKLAGKAPFPLYPAKIADKTRIVIEPENLSGPAPVIVLLVPEDSAESNFIEVSNTTLELQGVHLVLDGEGLSAVADDALLSAVSSDVFLRNCSLSVKGMPDSPMSALKIAGTVGQSNAKAGRAPRVLIDNTVIRGNNLTALTINTGQVNLALWNTLAWSGKAAALRFGSTNGSDAESARILRMASATLCSLNCAVQIAGDASQPVRTSIELLNSLLASPAGGKASSLLIMEGWNQDQHEAACGTQINWKSTASLYTGWTKLIQLNSSDRSIATSSAADWLAAWRDESPEDTPSIQADHWPLLPIGDIYWADFEALAPQTVAKQYVETGEGGWPGCQTERLPAVVRLESLAVAEAVAAHPQLPHGLFQSPARETIRVDLTREDLGKFLERHTLQNGTLIIASGTGVCQSSPIVIENAWVRLQFEPTGAAPLVLVPQPAKSKYDGFITVVNGGLEIVGGAFTLGTMEQKGLPNWFMQVIDSDLAMWRCCVRGPLSGAARNQGLIQWLAVSGRRPVRQFEGSYGGYAWFDSCYLAGSGTILEADMRRRVLAFKNCVVVSRDDLFSLEIGQPDSQMPDSQMRGVVDLSYSTLSAVDRFFRVRGSDLGTSKSSPLLMFADRCVFAPPLRSGPQTAAPTLMTCAGPLLDQKQFTWWENRCGYAPEITRFLRADSERAAAASQNFEQVWIRQWGAEQICEPLLGAKGVVLEKVLPRQAKDQAELDPFDFVLDPDCRAATWDEKHPIGASIGAMDVPPLRASATAVEKKNPDKVSAPTGGSSAPRRSVDFNPRVSIRVD